MVTPSSVTGAPFLRPAAFVKYDRNTSLGANKPPEDPDIRKISSTSTAMADKDQCADFQLRPLNLFAAWHGIPLEAEMCRLLSYFNALRIAEGAGLSPVFKHTLAMANSAV